MTISNFSFAAIFAFQCLGYHSMADTKAFASVDGKFVAVLSGDYILRTKAGWCLSVPKIESLIKEPMPNQQIEIKVDFVKMEKYLAEGKKYGLRFPHSRCRQK